MISENKAYTLSIFLTILMVFCTYISGYANENSDPVFIDGARAIRSIAENTPAGVNIGAPVAATDADGDTLTYSKGWLDGMAFTVDSATGQIQTKAALDYETQKLYSFAIFADDGNGGKTVTSVTINVTDVDETPANSAPVFTDGTSATRSIAENTASGTNIGTAIAATDADNDTLTYTLEGTDASSFSIVSTSGQLQTKAALDYEAKSSYSVRITVSDSKLTDTIDVTINVSDVDENRAPSFAEGTSTTRSIAENTAADTNIGSAVAATDPDDDTLTYTLGGADAAAFSINNTTGQLQTRAALDYEAKSSYSVRITVSDSKLTDTIDVTINVTDVDENRAPSFTEGNRATRSVAENTGSGQDIGSAVAATDPDDDTLTYTLGGTDAAMFSIVSTSGQLQTNAALDYEAKSSYSVRITVSDSKLTDSIDVTINVTDVDENRAPSFTEGNRATRSVAENTGSGQDIGSAVAATDPDDDTLTYTLGGTDASSFSINSTTGQLRTRAALDYETKSSYSVRITVSDSKLTDTIDVTINVTDVDENRAPSFTEGNRATRSVAENTGSGQDIGSAVGATDPDTDDTLTYTLGGTDASSFSIVSTSGQLQTSAALNYESKSSYSVSVSVSDGNGGSDSIDVTINVTNVNEAPSFANSTATRSIAENTAANTNIGTAISATDPDTGDTLTYTLGGADAAAFRINSTNGRLKTRAALDYETKTSYSVRITVSDSELTDTIDVTVNVTDVDENRAPSFADGASTTRSVAENTAANTNIGSAVAATDPDDDTLTYTLGGTDAAMFRINSTNGQLKTRAALDYETKTSYSVRITVSDSELTDTIDVTVNVTDVDENRAPSFTDGSTTTRSIAENTAANTNIGSAVAATDPDDDTLTYTLGGTDAAAFSIVSTSGQLRTNAALNYESDASYSVRVSVSDGNGESDSIDVTINVTDVNEAPNFASSTATRSIAENTGSGEDIGSAVSATDPDDDTLTYTLGGTDASSFRINSTTGQLRTRAALDYEAKSSYSVTITVSDSKLTDSIDVTINVTDVDENRAPSFADGTSTTRSIAENTGPGQDIGSAVAATDPDDDTLTYILGGTDAAMFSIVSTSGQLQTNAALDYEAKSSYSVRITVSDAKLTDTIDVTINVTDVDENRAPAFTAGASTTRSVAENTAADTNIGSAISATDPDDDTLTYTLGGTDAASFSIVSTSGQLQTNAALNYESKSSYSVTVDVSDGNGGNDSIPVTISVTNVNESPIFASSTAIRSIAENTASGEDIGSAVTATDPDTGDTLTYSLSGTDASSFSIVSTSGQLQTNAALDYETKTSYSVRITASDSELTDSIDVTINVTDVDENRAPSFAEGTSTTRSVAENAAADTDIGSVVSATDPDDDTLTYTLGGTDAAAFSIVSTSGQLQTKASLDYETKSSYSVSVSVSDGNGGSDSIAVTINVTDVNENRAPTFTAGSSTTRSIAENTNSGVNIGSPVAATDADTSNTLTYTLGGTDAAMFGIVSTSGQLQTKAALNYESKSSYSVKVDVSDGNGGSDSIPVTISVTDVNEAPSFASSTATRSIAENTGSGQDIGSAVGATDPDAGDTLTYTLGGADAAAFSIVSTSGQLQTNVALDYETKSSYSVTVTATDDDTLSDTTTVTISVTNVNEAPNFATTTATRSIAENTAADTNIGAAITATDVDANTTLTYTLGGTDAASFSIVSTSGQLQTSAALDYETKTSYSVRITVSDSELTDTIDVTINVTDVDENRAPSFAEGTSTTRSIAENTAADTNIGSAVSATDPDDDTLTYTVGGADAASFSIVSTSGQLQTNAALDYESKSSYSVTVSVSDGNGGSDSIPVTISVTDVNEAPSFANSTATRSVAENTAADTNIGAAITATDVDANTTLTYTLGGTDADSFSIVSTSGQLQTNAALDYETKASYSVTVTATDGDNLSDTTTVTISITDVNEAPSFATDTAARSIAENTAADTNIGAAITATDVDANTTLTYTLGGTDAAAFSIDSTTGQLQTSAALDYETKTTYSVRITVSDSELTDTIDVTINVTDVDENRAPSFTEGTSTTRSVAENTAADTNIGSAVSATDPDDDTLTYTVGGTDAAMFSIDSTTGQLQTSAALDYETKTSYTVTITVSDTKLTDTINVTVNVTNVDENRAPAFADGASTTRSVAENTEADTNIGSAVSATDPDADDTLTYSLSGADAAAFSIDSTTGQLQTSGALDYETKTSYAVTITVSDSELTDTIDVTISVTDVNEAPSFATTTATRSIAENTAANTNIGAAITATDVDANTTLAYTLGGADAASFSIVSTSGQLQTNAALDYETKSSYSVTVTATDGDTLSDTITVTITVTNVDEAPSFTEGSSATRSVAENTAADTNIGTAVAATDPDTGDTLTYTLGGADAASFTINSTSGQLRTSGALDYETKTSYAVTITASDSELTDTIDVTISVTNVNEAPSFATTTATRSIAENTAADTNIGAAITATDVDANTTLTYSLGGADAASFSIVSTSGQLQTNTALDHETKASYAVTVTATDGGNLSDTITVTISVTDVNDAPNFATDTAIRSVAENTAAGTNIGSAVAATDPDTGDTLTYTLGGTDAASFSIVSTSGQLRTSTALDYETKTSYSVRITVSDTELTDTIDVTINVTNVNEAPSFTAGSTATRTIAENTASGTNIGTAVTATDVDANTTLTYTLGGTDAATFSIVSTSGQLQTSAALNYETKTSYSVKISVADGSGGSDTIDVTINVTDVYEPIIHRTQQVQDAIVAKVPGVNHADYVTVAHLAAITELNLSAESITSLKSGDFNELPALTTLYLDHNSISDISALAGLTALTDLDLSGNSISNISALAGLTKLTTLYLDFNSISNISALAGLTKLTYLSLSNNSISNISALAGLTKLTELYLSFNSISDISALEGLTKLTYLSLSDNSISDYGPLYRLLAAIAGIEGHPGLTFDINIPPVFTEGTGTTRSVAENTASGQDIGTAVAATDAEDDTLTYSLEGADADSFSMDTATGQLQTKAALDYETKSSYSVTVSVSDGNGGTDTIAVTINITDINDGSPPSFTEGTSTTRSVAENTPSGQDIGTAVAATDADNDTLTYSLGGTDADSFSMDTATGQLQTSGALDYETKSSYSVTVSVSDGNGGTDTIAVTINVTNVTVSTVSQRTQQVQDAIVAAVPDVYNADEVTPAHLAAITYLDLSYQNITSLKSGDFSGLTGLTDLSLSGNSISNISALSGLTTLTYLHLGDNSISNISALSGMTKLTELYLWSNSISNISALSGMTKLTRLELSNNTISNVSALERLTALTDLKLSNNSISDYNPLRRLLAAIDGIEDHPGFTLDINIPPVFTDGTSTRRYVAEYTPSGQDIGDPVSATDANKDSLTYSLEGTDADAFNIDSATGQLQTNAALRYQTKRSYSVTVSVDDGYSGTDTIAVTIYVTDVNEASITPVNRRTQEVQDAIVAEVPDADSADEVTVAHLAAITELDLSYFSITSLKSGDFSGLPSLTELNLDGNSISNISPLSGLTKLTKLYLSANSITNISVLRGLTKLTYLDLSWNSITSVSALERLTTLTTLNLSGNSISNYDPLRRLLTAIAGIEGHPGLTLDINIPPVFTEGTSTTRSVAEYTPPSQDIGDPVSATDADGEYLSYSLEGTDADSFSIHGSTGQLQTSASLHYQTKRSYSVTVSVDDGYEGGTDTIAVTIYVTNVNEALITPVNQRTQEVQDAIVGKVSGVDNADDVTPAHLAAIIDLSLRSKGITSLKSSDFSGLSNLANLDLSGNSISNISVLSGLTKLTELNLSDNSISNISVLSGLTKLTTLYLERNAISNVSALERLTKLTNLYLESNPISDYAPLRRLKKANPNIYISINIENNPPQFTQGTNTTRAIAEDAGFYTDIGEPISATDTDPYDTLTYRFAPEPFGTSDAEIFGIDPTSGQLYNYDELDYEEQTSYTVIVEVSDGNGGMDRITVTIYVRDVAGAAPSLETSTLIPNQTGLLTNFPNPFNPETWIPYQLAKPAEVTLTIYDIRGVVVRELKLGHQPAGFYHNRSRAIHWDGRNAFGEKVATGVYFYTLKAGNFTATRKLLIRK